MTTTPPDLSEISSRLDAAVEASAAPAIQAAIVHRGEMIHTSHHGRDHNGVAITGESLFDLASVTKAAATSLVAAALLERGLIRLEEPLARRLPAFGAQGKAEVTLRSLLAHSSGLPAWSPMFLTAREDRIARAIYPGFDGDRAAGFERARALVTSAVLDSPLTGETGRRVYSDLGFIALGLLLEAAGGAGLDQLFDELIAAPAGLRSTRFFSLALMHQRPPSAVATGTTRPREPAPGQEALYEVHPQPRRADQGEVDDDNAYAMGGVAGHAGLFSTATELSRLGWLLIEELEDGGRLGLGGALRALVERDREAVGSPRALGFDLPSDEGSAAGERLGRGGRRGAIGHLGFTGCSLWIDLDRGLSIALLSNRTLPGREHVEGIRALRPAFHDLVVELVDGAQR